MPSIHRKFVWFDSALTCGNDANVRGCEWRARAAGATERKSLKCNPCVQTDMLIWPRPRGPLLCNSAHYVLAVYNCCSSFDKRII